MATKCFFFISRGGKEFELTPLVRGLITFSMLNCALVLETRYLGGVNFDVDSEIIFRLRISCKGVSGCRLGFVGNSKMS